MLLSAGPQLHSEGKSHTSGFIINVVVLDIIKLVPGCPNYGLKSCCPWGLVSHMTPLPLGAGPLFSAHSAPQNFSFASVHVFPGRLFSSDGCSFPRAPGDVVYAQITHQFGWDTWNSTLSLICWVPFGPSSSFPPLRQFQGLRWIESWGPRDFHYSNRVTWKLHRLLASKLSTLNTNALNLQNMEISREGLKFKMLPCAVSPF